jgi:hypothetical protein
LATHTGQEGYVVIGATLNASNSIGELKSWSVTETAATIDTTNLIATATTHALGQTSWSGNATAFLDETDSPQDLVLVGSSLTITFAFEGFTSGDDYMQGTATVTSRGESASVGGMAEINFDFTGTGALTRTTIA